MASRLIDTQVSQNASSTGALAIPLGAMPALFGTLGLNTAAAGPSLRVHFTATVTVSATVAVAVPISVTIFRVVEGVSTPVYQATETLPVGTAALTTAIVAVNGVDFEPLNSGFIVYQAFVNLPAGLPIAPTRVGPESFVAAAYSD